MQYAALALKAGTQLPVKTIEMMTVSQRDHIVREAGPIFAAGIYHDDLNIVARMGGNQRGEVFRMMRLV